MKPDRAHGFLRWKAVIFGLILRDIRTRYAPGSFGFAWAYVIPAAWVMGLVLFVDFLGHRPYLDLPLPAFVATGILPYIVFRQTIATATRAAGASRGLIGYAGIRFSDVLLAAALVELLNAFVVTAVILALLRIALGPVAVADPLMFVAGLAVAWALGAACGRFAAVVGVSGDFVPRVLPIALRPMFWISGIFFTAAQLPQPLAAALWFNPLLHATELLRGGYFGQADHGFIDLAVPFCAVALFYLASHAVQPAMLARRLEP